MQALPSDAAIRDTIAAVFRSSVYEHQTSETVFDRLLRFVIVQVQKLLGWIDLPTGTSWVALALLAGVFVAIVGRAVYVSVQASRLRAKLAAQGNFPQGMDPSNPWQLAQHLAASGNYTDAAHALYRHLLESLSRLERIQLHPSKTAGDYTRELRARSSAMFTRFRDFARSYEFVVYGMGTCDRERYERLLQLASAMTRPGG